MNKVEISNFPSSNLFNQWRKRKEEDFFYIDTIALLEIGNIVTVGPLNGTLFVLEPFFPAMMSNIHEWYMLEVLQIELKGHFLTCFLSEMKKI